MFVHQNHMLLLRLKTEFFAAEIALLANVELKVTWTNFWRLMIEFFFQVKIFLSIKLFEKCISDIRLYSYF